MSGVIVVGAGPGIGRSVAVRFAREGLPVAVIARSDRSVGEVAAAVRAVGVPAVSLSADSTDENALRSALDTARQQHGDPDVVVYNAALIRPDSLGDLSGSGHRDAWAVNVVGAITTAGHVVPAMAARGSGTFIVTGGIPEPNPQYMSLSLGKAGVRALVTMLDDTYGPAGVHIATVTVDGTVARGTDLDPDIIAEHYWRLYDQPRHEWQREITVSPTVRV